jgi:predicted AAA+ superfamily ATPase
MPLSYHEVEPQASSKTLDHLILDGLYPAIYAGRNIPSLFYPNYVKTYLERDVRELLQIKDMMQFRTFMRLCAGRVGHLFNASELSSEVGVTPTPSLHGSPCYKHPTSSRCCLHILRTPTNG